jgi:HAE1 family hydrophobic/amphiphilic exporter-1
VNRNTYSDYTGTEDRVVGARIGLVEEEKVSYLSRLSLKNRSIVALAAVAIVAFGVYAATALKQELVPSITLPAVTVVSTYQGASPEVVDREVTEVIEGAIQGSDGQTGMTAYSSEGVSIIRIDYDYGTDTDEAVRDLQQQIDGIQAQLPDDIDSNIATGSSEDVPVVTLAASTTGDEQALAEDLDATVIPELESIGGVNDASVTGVRDRIVNVTLDPDRLEEENLTTEGVASALGSGGVAIPAGGFAEDGESLSVQVGDAFGSVEEIEDIYVTPTAFAAAPSSEAATPASLSVAGASPSPSSTTGAVSVPATAQPAAQEAPDPLRLGEVAEVEVALEESSSLTRTDGEPSLGVSLTQGQDGNTVDISEDVRAMIPNLEARLGDGAELSVVTDNAPAIRESIEGLVTEGLVGLVFTVVVILVFLLSIRSTLVTAVSIPLSVLIALLSLLAFGYSLNILTLSALTVALGRIVDDSIVVLENIKRHLELSEEKMAAILAAVREVAGAVTSSTLATVAVFLPIVFTGGLTGELFAPFSMTMTIALLASLVVSLTVVPVLAYWFMASPGGSRRDPEEVRAAALARERRNPLQRAYVPVIRWTTRHRVITLALAFLVFAGSMSLVPRLETNFLDDTGQNTLTIDQELPAGSSLQTTDEAAKKVEAVLEDTDGVEAYQVTVGSADTGGLALATGGGASGSNSATFTVVTDADAERASVERDIRNRLDGMGNAGTVTVTAGDAGISSSNLEVAVRAADQETLREAAARVEEAVEGIPGTSGVSSDLTAGETDVRVSVDGQATAEEGLSEVGIGQAVLTAYRGSQVTEAQIDGERHDVYLRLGSEPAGVQELRALEISTPAGETVRLDAVADVEEVRAPTRVTRIDGERGAIVTATATSEDTGAVSTAMQQRLAALDLPDGASYSLGGVTSNQAEAFTSLLIAILSAIVLVYMIMVATFRSLVQPLALMVSVPFAATGVVLALLLTGTALGISALIGMLMLVGIVVTNAIVLLDLIRQYRDRGMGTHEAVVEGGRRRLRPILMTAVATICALLPMAVGITASSGFISQPLAIVVIGGLTTSTVLTLVIVPVLYTIVEDFKDRSNKRHARRRARREEQREARREGDSAEGK